MVDGAVHAVRREVLPDRIGHRDASVPAAGAADADRQIRLALELVLREQEVEEVRDALEELRSLCIEAEVKMVACQMTVDVFGFDAKDFIPEVTDFVGATSFLPVAQQSDVCLFI